MELEFHQLEQKYAGLRIADAGRTARLVASLCEHGQQQPHSHLDTDQVAGEPQHDNGKQGGEQCDGLGDARRGIGLGHGVSIAGARPSSVRSAVP